MIRAERRAVLRADESARREADREIYSLTRRSEVCLGKRESLVVIGLLISV
jgi:hypothetical protein